MNGFEGPGTVVGDAAVGFFADFLSAEGGLTEERNGLVTCVVPEELRRLLDLPEAVTVTADPDASREDDALLLAPGHPVIDAAADRVLETADVGICHLSAPAGLPPSLEALLPRVRDEVVIDHGRIEPEGDAPAWVRLPVLRAGALVVYDVTPEDRFHERAEVWVDATTGLVLPPGVSVSVDHAGPSGPDGLGRVLAHDPAAAVATAHRLLEQRAGERLADLARQRGARAGRDGEVARTEAYYRAALASLDSRRASAPPERRTLLETQADAVRAEQARRLREIDEKFESRFQLRPFRLQVVTLPALSLPLVARRGPRTWPLTVTWLIGARRTLPLRCPHCGRPSSLVAGKALLGCRDCLPGASLAPVAAAPAAKAAPPAPPRASAVAPPAPTVKPKGPARTVPHRAGRGEEAHVDTERVGERLARDLWRTVLSGRRWPRRDLAPGSPLEALARVYGRRSLLLALDLPEGMALEAVRVTTLPSSRGRAEVTMGSLTVRGVQLPFTLRWRRVGAAGLPGEVLPFTVHNPALLARNLPPCDDCPVGPPPSHLDPVARSLWDLAGHEGLPVLARALAAWWSAQAATSDLPHVPEETAVLLLDALHHWAPDNVFTATLGGPDWWAR